MKQFIAFSLIALSTLGSCKKTDHQPSSGIEIRFVNLSNEPLSNMQITDAKTPIGNLEAGKSTGYIRFERFKTDTDMPDELFTAHINGEQYHGDAQYHWCGTEKSELSSGQYTIGISKVENIQEKILLLRFQQN